MTITNLRIRLLKAQSCPTTLNPTDTAQTLTSISESPPSAPFAVYTLQTRGTCLCHGHAEYCVPYERSPNKTQDSNMVCDFSCKTCQLKDLLLVCFTFSTTGLYVLWVSADRRRLQQRLMLIKGVSSTRCVFQVFGKCLCMHHTEGDHCEKCAPLYNDLPWRPANGNSGDPNPCQSKSSMCKKKKYFFLVSGIYMSHPKLFHFRSMQKHYFCFIFLFHYCLSHKFVSHYIT